MCQSHEQVNKAGLLDTGGCGNKLIFWISPFSSNSLWLSPSPHTVPTKPLPHVYISRFLVPTLFPVPLPTGGWHSAACRIVQSIISISALSCLSVRAEISRNGRYNTAEFLCEFPQIQITSKQIFFFRMTNK